MYCLWYPVKITSFFKSSSRLVQLVFTVLCYVLQDVHVQGSSGPFLWFYLKNGDICIVCSAFCANFPAVRHEEYFWQSKIQCRTRILKYRLVVKISINLGIRQAEHSEIYRIAFNTEMKYHSMSVSMLWLLEKHLGGFKYMRIIQTIHTPSSPWLHVVYLPAQSLSV